MDIKQLFLREASLKDHHEMQKTQYAAYIGLLLLLIRQGVDLSHASKSRVLAALWARRDFEIADFLLSQKAWALPEVLKALQLLDAGRQIRALKKKLARLEAQGCAKPAALGQIRTSIQNILQTEEPLSSVSGALAKRVKRWIRRLPADSLAFFALSMPHEPWKELADIIHLRPDDFQLDWFLPVIFGEVPPKGSMAALCLSAKEEDLPELVSKWKAPYSFLRRRFSAAVPEALRGGVASYETLDTLLWYYEELACPNVDAVIQTRLQAGEKPTFGYGMLVERIFLYERLGAPFFRDLLPMAEARLKEIQLPLESPVVVIADASSSMDVAIRVATIVGSLLAALTGATIRFFDNELMAFPPLPTAEPSKTPSKSLFSSVKDAVAKRVSPKKAASSDLQTEFTPEGLDDVMWLVKTVKTRGSTAPAAALWPSLEKKEIVRHFVVVTDEEENSNAQADGKAKNQTYFAPMLKRYREVVYPARVAFVSFLRDPQKPGQMTTALEKEGIPSLCFPMNGQRPDLTKLDALLGLLASESSFFQEQADLLARDIERDGLTRILGDLDAHTKHDPRDILLAQIQHLRDLAFSRSSDRETFLLFFGKIRHFAKFTGHDLEKSLMPLMSAVAEASASKSLPAAFYEKLLVQAERWEILLQDKKLT